MGVGDVMRRADVSWDFSNGSRSDVELGPLSNDRRIRSANL